MFKSFDIKRNNVHIISLSCNTVPPGKYGGIELIVANLCLGLSRLGVNVTCYSPGEFSIEGVRHVKTALSPSAPIKDGGKPNTIEHLDSAGLNLKKYASRGDVIIFNHAEQFRYLKNRLGRLFFLRVNCVEIAHWMDAGLYKNIVYPADSLKKIIKKKGFVIPHGIDMIFGNKASKRTDDLFFAGRLTEDKGLDIALDACKKIRCKLVLAGPLSQSGYSEEIINDASVSYLGELSYKELFEIYSSTKAQVYMTQYTEPFGLSVVEAMAAGCPVITTGRGGTGETVVDGETGFFCETSDDIVSAYGKLDMIDSEDCMSRAKKYTIDKMSRSYLDLFDKL